MKLEEIILSVSRVLHERGQVYGDVAPLFEKAAAIASLRSHGRTFSAFDVAVVLQSLKDARAALTGHDHWDSILDGLGYAIIAAALSGAHPDVPSTAEVAAKFSPRRRLDEAQFQDALSQAVTAINEPEAVPAHG
jgi:hypothetical protein